MNKQFISTLGLCLLGLTAQAQWVQKPVGFSGPTIPLITDAVDANTAWQLSTDAEVALTVDGGLTWAVRSLPVQTNDEGVTSFSAPTATSAWATVMGDNGARVLKTSDGGLTWTIQGANAIYQDQNSFPDLIHFFSATEGITIGDATGPNANLEMYRTTDGGATWTPVSGTPAAQADEYPIDTAPAVVGNHIWFATVNGRVYHSPDKGLTWTVATATTSPLDRANLAFRDAQNGLLSYLDDMGTNHELYRTTDGGATWARVTYTGPLHGVGLSSVPGAAMFVSTGADIGNGDQGSSVSRDNGQTWVALENTNNHISTEFLSPTVGWSGGFTGTINQPTGVAFRFSSNALSSRTDAALQAGLRVAPNPAVGGLFTLQATHNPGKALVRVLDVAGRQVSQQPWAGTAPLALDLSAEPAGLYVLEVQGAAGTARQKVVVQ